MTNPRPAEHLEGMHLEGSWIAQAKRDKSAGATGGAFSVGYLAVRESDGFQGYLKALDLSAALQAPDATTALESMTKAYNYERNLVYKCGGLSRVVTPITDGSVTIDTISKQIPVPYIIFEMADLDSREQLDLIEKFDLAWRIRSLHHVATGLWQLHKGGVAHQDIKPSNVFVFQARKRDTPSDSSKVGDFGRSSMRDDSAPHDDIDIAGDCSYAPPELLYGYTHPDWRYRRFGCDAYLLGSLIYYFFLRVSISHAILKNMPDELHPLNWGDDYRSILPYVYDAWDEALGELENYIMSFAGKLTSDILEIVRQLTEPDLDRRGHPKSIKMKYDLPFSLERYVSWLDRLAGRAEADWL